MSEHTYKLVELVGTSEQGFAEAVRNGVKRAAETLPNLDWFEVTSIRGQIVGDSVRYYQVTMKVGARLEEGEGL